MNNSSSNLHGIPPTPETFWAESGNDIVNTNSGRVYISDSEVTTQGHLDIVAGTSLQLGYNGSDNIRVYNTFTRARLPIQNESFYSGYTTDTILRQYSGTNSILFQDSTGTDLVTIDPSGVLSMNAPVLGNIDFTATSNELTISSSNFTGGFRLSPHSNNGQRFEMGPTFNILSGPTNSTYIWDSTMYLGTQSAPWALRVDGNLRKVGVNMSTGIDTSAVFQIDSTDEGFLPPRMTGAEVEAIATPAYGLLADATSAGVGDVTASGLHRYNGTNWERLQGSLTTGLWAENGNDIVNTNTGKVYFSDDGTTTGKLNLYDAGGSVAYLAQGATNLFTFNVSTIAAQQEFYIKEFIAGTFGNDTRIRQNSGTDSILFQNSAGTDLAEIGSDGYFGVGITPTTTTHLYREEAALSNTSTDDILLVEAGLNEGGYLPKMRVRAYNNAMRLQVANATNGGLIFSGDANQPNIGCADLLKFGKLSSITAALPTPVVTFDFNTNTNVLIGTTTNPGSSIKLEVNGVIRANATVRTDNINSYDNTKSIVSYNGSDSIDLYGYSNNVTLKGLQNSAIFQRGVGSTITSSGAGNYSLALTDSCVFVTAITASGDTYTLPSSADTGQEFYILDTAGGAGTDNLTIDTAGSENINGSATQTISVNYGYIKVKFDGTNYFIIDSKLT